MLMVQAPVYVRVKTTLLAVPKEKIGVNTVMDMDT